MRAIETGHQRGHQAAILCTTEYICTVFRRESILTGLVPSARMLLNGGRFAGGLQLLDIACHMHGPHVLDACDAPALAPERIRLTP